MPVKQKEIGSLGMSEVEFNRQVGEARRRGARSLKKGPRALSAEFKNGRVTVDLHGGWSFSFDPRKYKVFKNASDEQLAEVKPLGLGFALEWESMDQHLGVAPLIIDLLGRGFLMSEIARRNGKVTSQKKKTASQANGKLGGRPKKTHKKRAA